MKRLAIAGAIIALVACAVTGTVFAYSDLRYSFGDPRNIHYILWKRGLNRNVNLDTAMEAFYLDTDRDQLIRGATEDQLKTRFGYIRHVGEVSRYYQQCLGPDATEGRSAVFLRDTPFMVVMDHERGSALILCKGY